MPERTRAGSSGMRTLRHYRAHAWTHPVQSVIVAAPLSLAILTLSVWMPLAFAVAAEALLLLGVPYVPAFQRRARRAWEEEARAAAASERAASLAMMTIADRAELERLGALVSDIDRRTACAGDEDDWHGLHAALASYVRLAVSRRAIDEAFTSTMGDELAREMHAVHEDDEGAPGLRAVRAQHRRLLSDRLALWCAMRTRVDVIACELATLAQLVRYAHDACVAASATEASTGSLATTLRGITGNMPALTELAALRYGTAGSAG